MDGLKDKLKAGWHPEGTESWRGSYSGVNTVAGWAGYGKDTTETHVRSNYVARPLTSLKDPESFGPPPKSLSYQGGASSPKGISSDKGGLETSTALAVHERSQQQREPEEPKSPPKPYRTDTTGLSTSHLPPPPSRKDGADGKPPTTPPRAKPGLPPRLPSRQTSSPKPAEPPSSRGVLNQNSLDRLGAAGISVPGFGIGGKQPSTPPRPSTASPSRETAAYAPRPASTSPEAPNTSQLSDLQSRFSRFGTTSPTSEVPSQGTTFAEKKTALKTAQAFRNDPSSVSLSATRNALSTANNFRQRHGDQVASGWKSANALNQKYGASERVSGYDASIAGSLKSPKELPATPVEMRDPAELHVTPIEMRDPTELHATPIEMRDNTTSPAKKAPPPPPKKKPGLLVNAERVEPPPIPLATKPKPSTNSSHSEQNDLDLDLGSLWFAARSPIEFPPPVISRLPGSRSHASSSGWSSDGVRRTYTFTGIIRHNINLATTKIHLTWDGSNPGLTVRAQQKHIPPPQPLTGAQLDHYRNQYSERLARWCEGNMGKQVGNGECWTLADEGLKAVAAECRTRNQEPCMTSQGLIHGALIYSYLPPKPADPPDGVQAAGVARGDIIQFLTAHFKLKNGGQSWAGAPDHTAVVTRVETGGVLSVVEQNTGGVKKVKESKYDFSELVSGEVRIFRAVGASWLEPLEASWP